MQMIELAERDISVYLCHFHLHILSANISIKFPCHYFVEWKSLNGKVLTSSQKYPSSSSASVQIGEVIELRTEMLYDNKEKLFYKKETLLTINLVSKSRPDQVKLVGRVNIDLAQIANNTVSMYSEFASYKLTYCSVNADVTFKVQMSLKELTNKLLNNLDKSSFNDFFIINTRSNNSSPQFGNKASPKSSTINGQSSKFSTAKLRQSHQITNDQAYKRVQRPQKITQREEKIKQNEQKQIIIKNNSISQVSKKDDTSFRTVAQRREPHFKSIINDSSIDHQQNLFTLRDNNNFSEEIDLNKKKITDLERKIGDLCKNLEDSKGTSQRRGDEAREKEELIQKLSSNEERMREQFEELKRLKISSSSQQNLQYESDDFSKPQSPKQSKFSHLYEQKISQALQTQRILHQNQYIIRQLEASRSELQKKLSFQRNETQQLQSIWKEKKEHYEEKIRSLQKEKRQAQYEVEQLFKYKFRVDEAVQERNKMKLQFKELEHQLMKARFELNNKIQKNAQNLQKLQVKETELQKVRQQLKDLSNQKINFQKQFTQLLISNEKLHSLNNVKQQEILKLEAKLKQTEMQINELRSQLLQVKRLEEEKGSMEEKLIQYNSHMASFQNTIKNLQNELQACHYITKVNQNLKQEISRYEKSVSQAHQENHRKQQIIQRYQNQINQLNNQIQKLTSEKQLLLQKNSSFSAQLQHIESMLQDSFHKASKETQLQIDKLKEQLKTSSSEYEQVLKQKAQLEEEIESIIEQKQETISQMQRVITGLQIRVQSLSQSLTDKQNIIALKDIELQNRKSITQQLALKLEKMEQKQNQMQQTIAILQTESKKIFDIIEEKQRNDEELILLRANTEEHLEIIKELQDVIVELKLQKEEILRNYYEEVEKREVADCSKSYHEDNSLFKKKLEEAEIELEEMANKIYHLTQQLNSKPRYINSLQSKNDSLLKKILYLQAMAQSHPQSYNQKLLQNNNNAPLTQSQMIKKRQMEMRLQQEKNLQKFVNQISELSQKVIELQAIINQKNQGKFFLDESPQEKKSNYNQDEKSQEITPIKHRLHDQLLNHESPQNNNFILSQRKKPTSNRSHDSHVSFEFIHPQNTNQNQATHENQNHGQNQNYYQKQTVQLSKLYSDKKSPEEKKESPELKISQLTSLIEVKNLIIKDLENKCVELTAVMRQKEKQLSEFQTVQKNSSTMFTGRIKPNSPRKDLHKNQHSATSIQGHHLSSKNKEKNRSRSPSPCSKIAKNHSIPEKELVRMKNTIQSQERQLKRLKKNLRLMNLQLITLRNLKKEKVIGETQIRINKSDIHLHHSSQINDLNNAETEKSIHGSLMMETQYFNLTNAVNPNQKSYIIKKTLNHQESLFDTRNSPKKPSVYGHIITKRDLLQKKFNITSRIGDHVLGHKKSQSQALKNSNNKENSNTKFIEQRIIQKLENTAHFSSLNYEQQSQEFITTISQLRRKINSQKEALMVLQEEKVFLENQLEVCEEEKFCLSSDLNVRQIQIYELYKSIVALRQEVRELKQQNESYLKLIEEHERNVNSIVRKASQTYRSKSKIVNKQQKDRSNWNQKDRSNCHQDQKQKPRQKQKLSSISVSNIDFDNSESHHLKQEDNQYESIMRQQRQQQRYSLSEKIEKYSLLEKIQKYEQQVEEELWNEKEKIVLQEEIQSREEILIDQNQKLYHQSNLINHLNSKIYYLESQLSTLNQLLNTNHHQHPHTTNNHNDLHINPTTDSNPNLSIILYENEALLKQNLNLKEETRYLGNQIDRINTEFARLNSLLYQRQEEITHLKLQLSHSQSQCFKKEQEYQKVILFLETSLHEIKLKLGHHNTISPPTPIQLSFFQNKLHDLNQQFQNLKIHVISHLHKNHSDKQDSDNKEFVFALLDSMQNNIITTFNVLSEVNSSSLNSQQNYPTQQIKEIK